MNTLRWAGLAIVSIVGWLITLPSIPVQIVYRLFDKKYDLDYYFKQIALGNDVMAGSMVYGSKHTISAITGHKAHEGSKYHRVQAKSIDVFFGKDHCHNAAIHEKLIKDEK